MGLSSSSDTPSPPPLDSESEGFFDRPRQHYRRISFLTDVEGDAAYFDRFVENSRILTFRDVEPRFGSGGGGGGNMADDNDVEGGYFPYDREVIFLDDHEDRIDESDKAALVYGGDVWDKGGSDLYVIRQLLRLRQRYGERVQFLMGNRDINKMRIVPEIGLPGTGQGSEHLPHHDGVFWLRGTGLVGDPLDTSKETEVPSASAAGRLRWILGKTMGSPDAFELRRSELKREREAAATAASLREHATIGVSDADVVESYRTTCHPTRGVLGRYLAEAKLALRMGEVAFMHGALPLTPDVLEDFVAKHDSAMLAAEKESDEATSIWSSFGFAMPWKALTEDGEKSVGNASEWVLTLNEFANERISAWKQCIESWESAASENSLGSASGESLIGPGIWSTTGGYGTSRCNESYYGSLLQYGMGWTPNKRKNPTVVYASWSDDGMPQRFFVSDGSAQAFRGAVSDFFDSAEIRLMVTGHQPNGDMPLAIHVPRGPFPVSEEGQISDTSRFIIACDISYSGDTHWISNGSGERRINCGRGDGASGRGDIAVSELLIEQCPTDGRILALTLHGVLSDGSPYECADLLAAEDNGPGLVGRLADRNRFVFEGSVRDDSGEEMDWWVKAKLTDDTYLLSSGKGYEVWNSIARRRLKSAL